MYYLINCCNRFYELSLFSFCFALTKQHYASEPNHNVVIGGSKVSTKLPVIKGLLNQVNTLVLGGGLAFTFMKAQGISIGTSLCEDDMVDTAKALLAEAKEKGKTMVLPVDAVCADSFPKGEMKLEDTKTFDLVPGGGIADGYMGLDAGPKTAKIFDEALSLSLIHI